MNKLTKIATALTVVMATSMFAGCSKTSATTADAPKAVDPKTITGEVNYATYNWDLDGAKKSIAEFNKVYPNVKVNVAGFDGDLNAYLTAQAASSKLPDVVYGWENLNFPISQGWVKPLDEFLAKDPEAKNLDSNIMNTYKFKDKTYAVPMDLQFSAILVNLDLVDQLNMDKPEYTWTIDQFKDLAKKATTDKTSGINHLYDFDDFMTAMYSKTLGQRGFDAKTGQFNLTDGSWVKAVNLTKELKAVPGLVSDDLKNDALTKAGKEDDYQKKFGKDADALRESKDLFGFHGTWDYSWIKTMNYKYDFYPLPQDPSVGYREGVHADQAYMLSNAKSPDAAYAFLKWISFGKDGSLYRLNTMKNAVDDKGQPTHDFFIPATNDKDVVSAFKALDYVPNGIKYMFDHKDKGFRGDLYKIVPDYSKIVDEVVRPQTDDIKTGKADAASVASELQKKANDALTAAKNKFESQIK